MIVLILVILIAIIIDANNYSGQVILEMRSLIIALVTVTINDTSVI